MLLARSGFDQDSAHIVSPSLVSKKLHLRINDGSQHSQREELQIKKIPKTNYFLYHVPFVGGIGVLFNVGPC